MHKKKEKICHSYGGGYGLSAEFQNFLQLQWNVDLIHIIHSCCRILFTSLRQLVSCSMVVQISGLKTNIFEFFVVYKCKCSFL